MWLISFHLSNELISRRTDGRQRRVIVRGQDGEARGRRAQEAAEGSVVFLLRMLCMCMMCVFGLRVVNECGGFVEGIEGGERGAGRERELFLVVVLDVLALSAYSQREQALEQAHGNGGVVVERA